MGNRRRRAAGGVRGRGLGTRSDEHGNLRLSVEHRRHHQRRLSLMIAGINLAASLEQASRDVVIALEGNTHLGGISLCRVRLARVRPGRNERVHRIEMAMVSGENERREAARVIGVDVGACGQERADHVGTSHRRGVIEHLLNMGAGRRLIGVGLGGGGQRRAGGQQGDQRRRRVEMIAHDLHPRKKRRPDIPIEGHRGGKG